MAAFQHRPRFAARLLAAGFVLTAATAQAATITVDSLADDVFPTATGALTSDGVTPVTLSSAKCTLRMAIAAANLDLAIPPPPAPDTGLGCAAGSGADTIVFAASLNLAATPGTITLASRAMSEAPATFNPVNTAALAVVGSLTITGPGSTQLTLDGMLVAVDGRRMLTVSDGSATTDAPFVMTGIRLYRGRTQAFSSGCMFSRESIQLDDVTFEACESAGGINATLNVATDTGAYGGALGVGTQTGVSNTRPTVQISNSKFLGNRSLRGTSTNRPDVGGAWFGSGQNQVGDVTLNNVLFNGNSAERAGAMAITDATSVTITGSHFIANTATGSGTGNGRYGGFSVSSVSGNVTINGFTRVNGNVANEERGGFGVTSVGGSVTIDTVDISGNYVNRGRIGGLEVLTDKFDVNGNCLGTQLTPVTIKNARIQGNSVAAGIGGFRVVCSGALTMQDSEVVGNEARGYRLLTGDVASSGNSAGFLGNATDATMAQSTATLTRVLFQRNTTNAWATPATGGGFGVFAVNSLGAFTADAVVFRDNGAEAGLGGLVMNARGAANAYLVVNSEFTGNEAPGGVAIHMETDGAYTIRNTTVAGNRARAGDFNAANGGIVQANLNTDVNGAINVTIEHSTIARNTANFGEAINFGIWANSPHPGAANQVYTGTNGSAVVRNTILGARGPGYTGTSSVNVIAQAQPAVSGTYSLLEWNGGAPAAFCTGTGMKCNVGALVEAAADNGGTGTRTMALQAGSPAINAGNAPTPGLTFDQRGSGFPRVNGGTVDMGAFESSTATTYGCTLDVDGNGTTDALTDGLLLIRAMFGLTGTSATNGTIGANPLRGDWASIRGYLNTHCGTGFAN